MTVGGNVQSWLAWLLWRAGINELARKAMASRGRFAVVLHGVAYQEVPGIPRPVHPWHTATQLRTTLDWLARRFRFLTPAQFLWATKPGILLTFDDGLANNYEVALPILEEYEAPAVFFVTTKHVDDPRDWLSFNHERAIEIWGGAERVPAEIAHTFFDGLSPDQLAACGSHPLITIGSHTHSHPFLTRCPDAMLIAELEGSRRYLREISGQAVDMLAYPTNDYDRRVAQATKAAGYRAAFAVKRRGARMPAFEIPRIALYRADTVYLSTRLNGVVSRAVRGPVLE